MKVKETRQYLPAGVGSAEVREVVKYPAVDATERDAFVWRVVHGHADQRRVRVIRLYRRRLRVGALKSR